MKKLTMNSARQYEIMSKSRITRLDNMKITATTRAMMKPRHLQQHEIIYCIKLVARVERWLNSNFQPLNFLTLDLPFVLCAIQNSKNTACLVQNVHVGLWPDDVRSEKTFRPTILACIRTLMRMVMMHANLACGRRMYATIKTRRFLPGMSGSSR